MDLIALRVFKGETRGKETIGVPPSKYCHGGKFMVKA